MTKVQARQRTVLRPALPTGALLVVALLLSACADRDDRILFDGEAYRAKASRIDRQIRDQFTVSVRPVSASLAGAREAGRYEATAYCIDQYGTSDIDWLVGPDDPAEQLSIDGDTLILAGTCRF